MNKSGKTLTAKLMSDEQCSPKACSSASVQFKSSSQGGVKELYRLRDKQLPQSVCAAGKRQQPVNEAAPVPCEGAESDGHPRWTVAY